MKVCLVIIRMLIINAIFNIFMSYTNQNIIQYQIRLTILVLCLEDAKNLWLLNEVTILEVLIKL